jgi:hypothetical protein
MLFTNIQLDDFAGTLARFLRRLERRVKVMKNASG